MKRLILAFAAAASLSVMAAPAHAQFGSGAYGPDPGYLPPPPPPPLYGPGPEGVSPYPPHYGPFVGPFGGDALARDYGPPPGYIEHDETRPYRKFRPYAKRPRPDQY